MTTSDGEAIISLESKIRQWLTDINLLMQETVDPTAYFNFVAGNQPNTHLNIVLQHANPQLLMFITAADLSAEMVSIFESLSKEEKKELLWRLNLALTSIGVEYQSNPEADSGRLEWFQIRRLVLRDTIDKDRLFDTIQLVLQGLVLARNMCSMYLGDRNNQQAVQPQRSSSKPVGNASEISAAIPASVTISVQGGSTVNVLTNTLQNVNASNIQQGGIGSQQDIEIGSEQREHLAAIIDEINKVVSLKEFPKEHLKSIAEHKEQLEKELKSEHPKLEAISKKLAPLKSALEAAAASVTILNEPTVRNGIRITLGLIATFFGIPIPSG